MSGAVVLAFVGLHTLLLALVFHESFQIYVSDPFELLTGGLVPHSLSASALQFALLIGGVALVGGGLRIRDVGLHWGTLPNGILLTLLLWGGIQIVMGALNSLNPVGTVLNPIWRFLQHPIVTGRFLLAPFGSALIEEVLYRGFLFPQLYLLVGAWAPVTAGPRLLLALGVSQGIFGLNHIPAGHALGLDGLDLVVYITQVMLVGVLFAVLYLQTENVLAVAGIHALINNPLSFFLTPVDPSLVALSFGVLLMFGWPAFDAWSRKPTTASALILWAFKTPTVS